jgi:DNA invertase Pin-like site-specific DNA recombinase
VEAGQVQAFLHELIDLVNELREQGVEFVSLREKIDTATPGGTLVFHVFGAGAEFERGLILERTMTGLEAARVREERRQDAGVVRRHLRSHSSRARPAS